MRINSVAVAAVLVAASLTGSLPAAHAADRPREMKSLPGQIQVVTVNARQNRTLDESRFSRLSALAEALRIRPAAFNGGSAGAVTTPDVIVITEMSRDNQNIFRRLLNIRFDTSYEIAGPAESRAKFLYNSKTLVLGSVSTWLDACYVPDAAPPGPDSNLPGSKEDRTYQWAAFTEKATGAPLAVAGVHFKPKYTTGANDCKERNVDLLRLQVESFEGAIVAAGDFNRRPVERPLECDPREQSPILEWYRRFTSPDVGRAYIDSVGSTHHDKSGEWTHHQKSRKQLCNASVSFQRARLDYIFTANVALAEAHTDHPGWGGDKAGSLSSENPRYSDHRFVWARVSTAPLPRPKAPQVTPGRNGSFTVSWPAMTGAQGYVLYKAVGRKDLKLIAEIPAGTTSFEDRWNTHGQRYRFAVAGISPQGGIGVESRTGAGIADRRGPHVIGVTPGNGARGVSRRAVLSVRFDEAIADASVLSGQIRLFKDGRRVAGRVRKEGPRLLVFDPARRLQRNQSYRAVVRPVEDRLGNVGNSFSWRFKTGRR